MNPSHLFLILIILPSALSDDLDALLRLRDAVRGTTLLWNSTAADAPCSWEGVKCARVGGAIPRVRELRLPGDTLTGQIPAGTIGNLSELRVLSLRRNSLSGPLPSDIASCTRLRALHLQWNNFSGEIPARFFTLSNLRQLNLARNSFSGSLPPGFANLTLLRTLRLENNRFTGSLPDFGRLNNLADFNVSSNGLNGSIPSDLGDHFNSSSFLETSLCGRPLVPCSDNDGKNLSSGAIAGIAVGSALSLTLVLLLVIVLISWTKLRARKIQPQIHRSPEPTSPENSQFRNPNHPIRVAEPHSNSSAVIPHQYHKSATKRGGRDGLTFFGDAVEAFTLKDLLKASAEMVGRGTVGSTYKAYFDNGVEVVVKRLRNVYLPEEIFRAKIEEVGSLVHDNLEPLRGYFYGRDEKLLLYEPMPNGSLSELLHGGSNKGLVSWKIRARIAVGAAQGIEYIHSIGPGTAHGNIKSSNVFLADNYGCARVSEFGLVQLVSSVFSLSGYRAPEVADTRRATQEADVYSFGVVILELVTGKDPDRALMEEGIQLPSWVQSGRWRDEVLDPNLDRVDPEMVRFVQLAVSCTELHPDRRPPMKEVVRRLSEICRWGGS